MSVILKNNVEGFLATTISASDVSLVLQPGDGAAFPNPVSPDYFYATLVSTGGTVEVVRVTARAGDTLSILRGQDGTTANSFAAGSRLEMRVNAQSVIDTVYSITNYQGASTTNPTTRLDGSALQAGDFYFNTSAAEVRFYNGVAWQSLTTGSIDVQNFVGNGTQTTFTLSQAPTGEDNTQVYIKGVYQQKDTYSISGLSLIFSTAPPAGTTIEVVTIEAIAIGQTSSDLVSYQPAGVAAVPTTVREKLRETVSVKDFGAVGDGVADDTAAIQAALTTGKSVYMPSGRYKVTSSLQLTKDGQILYGDGRYDQTRIQWAGSLNDTVIEQNNTTLKWHCVIRDLRIEFNADGMTGIDWSNVSYGTIENVNIDGYGNNTVGVRLKGNDSYGDRPYYNIFRQIDIASNNIGGVTSGSIGWYGQRAESPIEPGNFNGPNANQWFGGRCAGMDKAFYFEDGIGNSFNGCVTESVKVSHFEFGVATPYYPAVGGAAVLAATVNTLTDNSNISMTTNQYANGMLYILSGTGAGQYRQILFNTTSVFTVYPYWNVVPDNTSTYQIFPEAGQNNTIQGCYGEGDATSSPDYLKLHPGVFSTYIYGGLQSSLGTIIDDVPRVGNRFNPAGWKDPVPFTFNTADLPKNSSGLALVPVGWLRNNLSIPGYWHVSAIDVGINGAITSGTIKIWVTENGTKKNVNPDLQITSLSSFNTSGGSVKQSIYSTNAIVSTSGYSQFGVQVDTDSILLPDATLDLYVTLYVVARG